MLALAFGLAAVGCGVGAQPAPSVTRTARDASASPAAVAPAAVAPTVAPVAPVASPVAPGAPGARSVPRRRPPHSAAAPKPLAGKTIALDPGHNGDNYLHPGIINSLVPAGRGQVKACDTTGTSTNGGYSEASFNFDVALRLQQLLVAQGAHVVLTRHTNTGVGPCVNVRAAIGNSAHADAVIAIHADGAPAGDRGFSVLYAPDLGSTARIYAPSLRLAHDVNHALGASGVLSPASYLGPGGYSVRSDLAGLNLSTRPKIFAELGNMRNSTDAAIQSSARGRQRLAEALDAGLERYLGAA